MSVGQFKWIDERWVDLWELDFVFGSYADELHAYTHEKKEESQRR